MQFDRLAGVEILRGGGGGDAGGGEAGQRQRKRTDVVTYCGHASFLGAFLDVWGG